MDVVSTPTIGIGRQGWNFARHWLEMCVPMCVVGTPLVLLVFVWGPAAFGYADPRGQFLMLSVLATGVLYTIPMAAWMRLRGMDGRPTLEMAGATVGLAIFIVALGVIGPLSDVDVRALASPTFCGPACLLMTVVMLYRLDLYTGRTGHHMGPRVP
jgi:hypothetical protein